MARLGRGPGQGLGLRVPSQETTAVGPDNPAPGRLYGAGKGCGRRVREGVNLVRIGCIWMDG